MKTLIINNPDSKISKCPYCGTESKLSPEEFESKTFICPNCRRENVIWDLREDYYQDYEPEKKNTIWEVMGFVSAVLSFCYEL